MLHGQHQQLLDSDKQLQNNNEQLHPSVRLPLLDQHIQSQQTEEIQDLPEPLRENHHNQPQVSVVIKDPHEHHPPKNGRINNPNQQQIIENAKSQGNQSHESQEVQITHSQKICENENLDECLDTPQHHEAAGPLAFGSEDHNIFRLSKMIDNEGRKVMHLIYTWGSEHMRSLGGKSVERYLKEDKNITNSQYKQIFNKDEREKVLNDIHGTDYDIPLLLKCIKWVCEGIDPPNSKKWTTQNDECLEWCLSVMKDLRNDLKHRVKITNIEFQGKVEKLKSCITKVFHLAGTVYLIDCEIIQKNIKHTIDNINHIQDSPIEDYDIITYSNRVCLNDISQVLDYCGKEEITDTYEKFKNFNPVSFITGEQLLINVGIIFTRLEVVENSEQDEKKNKKIEYENLLQFGKAEHDVSNKIRLMEGPAGSGKTTLLRKIMDDWCLGVDDLNGIISFDLLLYMECRDSTIRTFTELLNSLLPETAKKFSKDNFKKCVLNRKLFVLVDGIDELNKNSTVLFKELLQYKRKYNIFLFCTTRPERVEDFYKMLPSGEEVVHFKVVGITDSRRVDFASKYHEEMRRLGKSTQETKGLKDYLTTSGSRLQEHWRLPLNLVLLVVLWAISPEKVNTVTTATELYFEIYKLSIAKLVERIISNKLTTMSMHDLKHNIDKFVLELCSEALLSLKNDEIILSKATEKKLRNASERYNLPVDDTISAFLVNKVVKTATGMTAKQSFPHKGLQDFYSAISLLLRVKEKGIKLDLSRIIQSEKEESFAEQFIESNSFIRALHRIHKRTKRYLGHLMQRVLTEKMLKQIGVSLNATTVITEVLEELHPNDRMTKNYLRFNNAFIHFTGILHMITEGKLNKRLVTELISTLYHTGVKTKDQWLELLADVKCDDIVAEVIADKVFSAETDNLKIEDKKVYSFSSLFLKKCPKSVSIIINSRPEDIPRLKNLLCVLCEHQCDVIELAFMYNFQFPNKATEKMDDITYSVFENCSVQNYCGMVTSEIIRRLPSTITKLRVSINNNEMYNELHSAISPSSSPPSINSYSIEYDNEQEEWNDKSYLRLRRLVIHLPPWIDYTQIQPLPLGVNIHLILSNVTPDNLENALNMIKAVQPVDAVSRRGITNILFPSCTLREEDFKTIVQEVLDKNISIGSTLATSSHKVTEECVEQLNILAKYSFKFVMMADDDIWNKW